MLASADSLGGGLGDDGGSPAGKEGPGELVPEGNAAPLSSPGRLYESPLWAEKVLPGGGVERVAVRVEPYGDAFVKVLSGLAEGDVVKAQGVSSRSGESGQGGGPPPSGGR